METIGQALPCVYDSSPDGHAMCPKMPSRMSCNFVGNDIDVLILFETTGLISTWLSSHHLPTCYTAPLPISATYLTVIYPGRYVPIHSPDYFTDYVYHRHYCYYPKTWPSTQQQHPSIMPSFASSARLVSSVIQRSDARSIQQQPRLVLSPKQNAFDPSEPTALQTTKSKNITKEQTDCTNPALHQRTT